MMNLRLSLMPLLFLAACQETSAVPPLAGASIGGPFALVDQNGHSRSDRDFTGKYRIMYFGYTFCPDVCPVDVAHIAAGYRAFAKVDPARAARVVPIFVTVDPERDTPSLIGLTGTSAQIAAVTKAYGVPVQINKRPGNAAYLVDHGRATYLMGPDNKPIALLSQDATPEVIASELKKWVR
jgi:protein SCO1/2